MRHVLVLVAVGLTLVAGTWFASSTHSSRSAARKVDAAASQAAEILRRGREATQLVTETRLMVLQSLRGKLPTEAEIEGVINRAEQLKVQAGTEELGAALGDLVDEWRSILEHGDIVRELDREVAGLHEMIDAKLLSVGRSLNGEGGASTGHLERAGPAILGSRLNLQQIRIVFLEIQLNLLRHLEDPRIPEPDDRPIMSLFESLRANLESSAEAVPAQRTEIDQTVNACRDYQDRIDGFFGVFFDVRNRLRGLADREQALLASLKRLGEG